MPSDRAVFQFGGVALWVLSWILIIDVLNIRRPRSLNIITILKVDIRTVTLSKELAIFVVAGGTEADKRGRVKEEHSNEGATQGWNLKPLKPLAIWILSSRRGGFFQEMQVKLQNLVQESEDTSKSSFSFGWIFPQPCHHCQSEKTSQISTSGDKICHDLPVFVVATHGFSTDVAAHGISKTSKTTGPDFAPGSWIGNRSRGEATDEEGRWPNRPKKPMGKIDLNQFRLTFLICKQYDICRFSLCPKNHTQCS